MNIQIQFEILIPDGQELLRLVKKYAVVEVVGTAFWRLCTAKVHFCCGAQPPKWRAQPRTQPQIAVFVSEVVIAKSIPTGEYISRGIRKKIGFRNLIWSE